MIKEAINGFCMALADSVPGVSGGTVAFIMGFYDAFITSIHNLVFGTGQERRQAIVYLLKLGTGWIIGMGLAVLVLSASFERHIYIVSSLFFGFVLGAIPLIAKEEKESVRNVKQGILFGLLGILLVAGITWANGTLHSASMDLSKWSVLLAVQLFVIGMIAISAMFLPGISGSTLLLIFGAYIPVITAIKGVLTGKFIYIPALMCFGFGVLTGAVSVVKGIKFCLDRFRVQSIYMILGMMIGSFYAIVMGPTTLSDPKPPLDLFNVQLVPLLIGGILVLAMQWAKERLNGSGEKQG